MKIIQVFIVLIFLLLSGFTSSDTLKNERKSISAREIVERIQKNVNYPWMEKTRDTFKSGNPEDEVSGVVTTFIATMDVLKKAVEMNCNMIVTHEPTYYEGEDNYGQIADDAVFLEKKKYIEDHKLIIWRFHDHWHRMSPDGIYVGMTRAFGWEGRRINETEWVFDFGGMKLKEIADELKNNFPESDMRIVGDPEMPVQNTALALGAVQAITQINLLQKEGTNLLIVGESREWETVEYVRDAMQQGKPKALILFGHALSEEMGMQYFAEWLQVFVKEVPVYFVAAGDPFWRP